MARGSPVNTKKPAEVEALGSGEVQEASPAVGIEGLALWRVTLRANTPLAHPTLEIRATDPESAKKEFCKQNNISGSRCEWDVQLLTKE